MTHNKQGAARRDVRGRLAAVGINTGHTGVLRTEYIVCTFFIPRRYFCLATRVPAILLWDRLSTFQDGHMIPELSKNETHAPTRLTADNHNASDHILVL